MTQYGIGDRVRFTWEDVDGGGHCDGVVTELHDDHITVYAGGMKLWLDEDTAHMFTKIEEAA